MAVAAIFIAAVFAVAIFYTVVTLVFLLVLFVFHIVFSFKRLMESLFAHTFKREVQFHVTLS